MNLLLYITRASVFSNNDPYPISDVCNPVVGGVGEGSTWMFAYVIVLGLSFSRLMPGHTITHNTSRCLTVSLYEANK